MQRPKGRAGLGAAEVIVCVVMVAFVALLLLARLPRQRESARAVGCQHDLRQIGEALALYARDDGHLPTVPPLGPLDAPARPGPLGAILGDLGLDDFRGFGDPAHPPRRRPARPVVERPLPGFVCASDPNATAGLFPAPISYRAVAGDDPAGLTGPFAPGRRLTLSAIEAADGLGFTAAFAERLVGDARSQHPDPADYARVPGPIRDAAPASPPFDAWLGDAGSSWAVADWRSTLENHVLPPDGSPSLIAADGRTARMGASSGHGGRVHVLILDGSVRPYTPRVDLRIWRGLANIADSPTAPALTAPAGPSPSAAAPGPRP